MPNQNEGAEIRLTIDQDMADYVYEDIEITKAGGELALLLTGNKADGRTIEFLRIDWVRAPESRLSEAIIEAWNDAPYGAPPAPSPGQGLRIHTDNKAIQTYSGHLILANGETRLWRGTAPGAVFEIDIADSHLAVTVNGTNYYREQIVKDRDADEDEENEYYERLADEELS